MINIYCIALLLPNTLSYTNITYFYSITHCCKQQYIVFLQGNIVITAFPTVLLGCQHIIKSICHTYVIFHNSSRNSNEEQHTLVLKHLFF